MNINKGSLVLVIFLILSCNPRSKFDTANDMISSSDKSRYQSIYLIGENSCNSCYLNINNVDENKSIVYVFSKSGNAKEFITFFNNLKVQRNFDLLDYAAEYTKDFKGPYKVNIENEKITDIISYNN